MKANSQTWNENSKTVNASFRSNCWPWDQGQVYICQGQINDYVRFCRDNHQKLETQLSLNEIDNLPLNIYYFNHTVICVQGVGLNLSVTLQWC